jgi:chemotaxis protein methyltransferase CheR
MNSAITISDKEFELFQKLIYKEIGISLNNSKKLLVQNRLLRRLMEYKLSSFGDYYRLVQINSTEKSEMLNQITTNETYFFREKSHFEFLDRYVKSHKDSNIRIWSAASSVGAEAYSIAMTAHEHTQNYEVFGSDINSEVVKKANIGLYPLKWMDKIDEKMRQKYCLRGKGKHEGWFLVDRLFVKHVKFQERNLMEIQRDVGMFDIIFLRNVLIYFDKQTKIKIINNVIQNLKVGGYFVISLTENIHDLDIKTLTQVDSSIFQKGA